MSTENHLTVQALSYSPIRGPEGNIEYLIHLKKNLPFAERELVSFAGTELSPEEAIELVVEEAFSKI